MNYSITILCDDEHNRTFIAIEEMFRSPMGIASIKVNEEKREAYILNILRHPEYGGCGLTKDLIKHCIRHAEKKSVEKIYCGVYKKRDGLQALLLSMGFKQTKSDSLNHNRFCLRSHRNARGVKN